MFVNNSTVESIIEWRKYKKRLKLNSKMYHWINFATWL